VQEAIVVQVLLAKAHFSFLWIVGVAKFLGLQVQIAQPFSMMVGIKMLLLLTGCED